mmetsp:Transcript_22263/g.62450  ORF Transcript_22263/g.62450 Transcript_22263/m.62450 type:complete len:260 (+) Transcript_22263:247-1026(+)
MRIDAIGPGKGDGVPAGTATDRGRAPLRGGSARHGALSVLLMHLVLRRLEIRRRSQAQIPLRVLVEAVCEDPAHGIVANLVARIVRHGRVAVRRRKNRGHRRRHQLLRGRQLHRLGGRRVVDRDWWSRGCAGANLARELAVLTHPHRVVVALTARSPRTASGARVLATHGGWRGRGRLRGGAARGRCRLHRAPASCVPAGRAAIGRHELGVVAAVPSACPHCARVHRILTRSVHRSHSGGAGRSCRRRGCRRRPAGALA